MIRALLPALVLVALAGGAAAAELRPLGQNDLCLDAGTEVRPGVNAVKLAPCNSEQTQNVRKGEQNTIYIGSQCFQAVKIDGKEDVELFAASCHGRTGQVWAMTRDGRLTPGNKLCLTVIGKGAAATLSVPPCKEAPADMTDQKWAIYGKF
jgi:hypothetical protein